MDFGFSPDDDDSVTIRTALVTGEISIEEAIGFIGLDETLRILGMR